MNNNELKNRKDKILILESENRLLINKYNDLEFTYEELLISEDLSEPKKINENLNEKIIYEKKLLELKNNYLIEFYENRKKDLEFLQLEIQENQNNLIQNDSYQNFNDLIESKQKEIITNNNQIEVLKIEEMTVSTQISNLIESLDLKGDIPNSSINWSVERESLNENFEKLQKNYLISKKNLNDIIEKEKLLKKEIFEGYLIENPEEIKKSLSVELLFGFNNEERNLLNIIEIEKKNTINLEKELEEIKLITNYIKNHRENCFDKERKFYDISTNQQRLKLLQKELNEISDKLN